ncbi:MAG: NblA/ycf18 family protein [Leptolyngbyaceae cyanobacterium CAN_BIN12]|nr:NblA/ycf18 family protein [Leptolyngbyaceae cyanobacterium CAN_BIN12]
MLSTINPEDFQLSTEQHFMLERLTRQIEELPPDQLRTNLLESVRQMMIKDNVLRSLIRARS